MNVNDNLNWFLRKDWRQSAKVIRFKQQVFLFRSYKNSFSVQRSIQIIEYTSSNFLDVETIITPSLFLRNKPNNSRIQLFLLA